MQLRGFGERLRTLHDRFWAVPPVLVGMSALMVGVATGRIVLPAPPADTQGIVLSQLAEADGALCAKFGFPPGTERYSSCKLELQDMHRRDAELQSVSEF